MISRSNSALLKACPAPPKSPPRTKLRAVSAFATNQNFQNTRIYEDGARIIEYCWVDGVIIDVVMCHNVLYRLTRLNRTAGSNEGKHALRWGTPSGR